MAPGPQQVADVTERLNVPLRRPRGFDIAVAQREAEVEPHGVGDHLTREAVAAV